MSIIEILKETGELATKAEFEDGTIIQMFTRKRTGNKGWIVTYWTMDNGIQKTLIEYGEGKNIDSAKKDLKEKILSGSKVDSTSSQ